MTGVLPLRPYQAEGVDAVFGEWQRGVQRTALVWATGLGKTVGFAHVAQRHLAQRPGGRVLILAHTTELVDQGISKMRSVAPGIRVGRVQANVNETLAKIVCASVQTLRSENRRRMLRDVSLVIVDECFPAGTMVGSRRIEDLRIGDLVPSYDEESGELVSRPVTATMKRKPRAMVRVHLADGEEFACTPNHPIMTPLGWIPAGELQHGVPVLSFAHDAAARGTLREVRKDCSPDGQGADRLLAQIRTDLLFGRVSGRREESGVFGSDGSDESPARVGSDEGEQSDGTAGAAGEDGRDAAWRAWTEEARGQWKADSRTSATAGRVPGLADGGCGGTEGRSSSVSLQTRHSASDDEGLHRSGRGIPLLAGAPRIGWAARRSACWTRVADVQILERGSDETYDGVCVDGLVYNLDVAGTHTYLIGSGVVAHNCHHAVASTYMAILNHYGCMTGTTEDGRQGALVLGVTATMMRGDEKALGAVWQSIAHQRTIAEGIADGFLVRPRGLHVTVDDLDLSQVKVSRGDYNEGQLGQAIEDSLAPQAIAKAVAEHAPNRKMILFAPTVSSAEVIGDALSASGRAVGLVHGALAPEARKRVLDAYRARETTILASCQLPTEGFDDPETDGVIFGRPTRSRGFYIQMAGRALRPYPGKTDALLLDVVGATVAHSLISGVTLFGDTPGEKAENTDSPKIGLEDPEELAPGQQDAREALGLRDGPLVTTEVDLFAGSPMAWLRTRAGVYFIEAGERYITIVPAAPKRAADWMMHFRGGRVAAGYDVRVVSKKGPLVEQEIVGGVEDLSYAMAWAEGAVTPSEKSTATRERSWRARPPSEKLKALAERLRVYIPPGARMGEVSNMVSLVLASRRIDPLLQPWVTGAR